MNIGVLLSGDGTTAQALIKRFKVVVVISNVESAKGLERARSLGIPAIFIDPKEEEYAKRVLQVLEAHKVLLVCLAGYLKLVKDPLLSAYRNRMMNIHPALLPAFPGKDSQKQALAYEAKVTGNTVHFVDEGCDTGPIILQEAMTIYDTDDEELLSEKLKVAGHSLYVKAVRLFIDNRITVIGREVRIR